MLKRLFYGYSIHPVRFGALVGALGGLGVFSAIAVVVIILYLIDRVLIATGVSDGTAGFSLLSGFVIGPIAFVLGMPWTYFLEGKSPWSFIVAVALGLTINGAIIGLAFGSYARLRPRLKPRQ